MKKIFISLFVLSILSVNINAQAAYYDPRASVWGLAGTENQGRLDVLLPVASNPNNLFFTDVQGGYAQDDASYGGIGAGFRTLINNAAIYGGYVFVDRDESDQHNEFTVLSPGAETLFSNWDFRANGYFPVNERKKTTEFFPALQSGCGDCGMNCSNSQNVVFTGHTELAHRFAELEQAGPGADGEVGYTFHHLHNTQLHAGVYYFNYNSAPSTKNITGIEGRLEVPVNAHWAVTVESSYDNYQHAEVVGGLRLNLFGVAPAKPYADLHDQMNAPITRNIGSLSTGDGIPIVRSFKDEGLAVARDNIYFFTSQGGSAFVNPTISGTFENPLRNDQFSQSVVNQIGNNANLYFNTGTFIIMGAGTPPNAQIDLPLGDSIYGRTLDFKSSATGAARPELLGRINLLAGNNTLDSIQLINSAASTGGTDLDLIALNIQNAPNVFLCNDAITANAAVTGNLGFFVENFASGIYANNSQITMQNSTVNAVASVSGDDAGVNAAVGIGGNSIAGTADSVGNQFTIINSDVSGVATVGGNVTIANYASGIGGNTALGNTNFSNNNFVIVDSNITGTAQVGGSNSSENFATGIGGNYGNFNIFGTANFNANNFSIANSNISSSASIANNNVGFNSVTGIGGNISSFNNNIINITNSGIDSNGAVTGFNQNAGNTTTGIGSNFGDFISNTININSTEIIARSNVGSDQDFSSNYATGIGSNGFSVSSATHADFENNTINIANSTITAVATVNGNNTNVSENFATGVGNNFTAPGFDVFNGNTINIANSTINATATVAGDNLATTKNEATGVKMNNTGTPNIVNIDQSTINVLAQINGSNGGENNATGLFANPGDIINIANSTVNITALVGSVNTGTNTALQTDGGGTFNITNTQFNVIQNP